MNRYFIISVVLSLTLIGFNGCTITDKKAPNGVSDEAASVVISNDSLKYELKRLTVSDSIISTFILVRHAEKDTAGTDPHLTLRGQRRAQTLYRILNAISFDALFSSPYNRTLETARPIASAMQKEIIAYDPRNLDSLAQKLTASFAKQKVLIVGHSNTTPQLANLLDPSAGLDEIPEDEYHHMIICSNSNTGIFTCLKRSFDIEDH